MEKQPLIAQRIKKVIDALKKGPMKWSELTKLGIPEKTLHRILTEHLEYWGFVKKREDGRWSWCEHVKSYETREDYEIALKHSEELFIGLDAILAEEINLCLQLPHPLSDLKGRNLITEGNELKPFAEEHLKTGYPNVWEEVEVFRRPLFQWQKLEGKRLRKEGLTKTQIDKLQEPEISGRIKGLFDHLRGPEQHKLTKFEKQRIESFAKLANYFFSIRLKVKMGEPLLGSCQLCPKVHIKGKTNL